MSSANLDLVRSILSGWERGDWGSLEWVHPEIEYVIADGPAPGTWRGLAGMAESYGEWLSAWEDFRIDAEDYREIDDERVLVLTYYSGRAKTSQGELGPMRAKAATLFHVRDGKGDEARRILGPRARVRRPRPDTGHRTPAPSPAAYSDRPASRNVSP